jgi:hypothetical protein
MAYFTRGKIKVSEADASEAEFFTRMRRKGYERMNGE